MEQTFEQIRESALALPEEDRLRLALQLSAEISPEVGLGEPEPGYEEWFRAEVKAALADEADATSHEHVVGEVQMLLKAARETRGSKAGA